nr:hypothetical protein HUO10_003337 [Paraburkholderia busanensis]
MRNHSTQALAIKPAWNVYSLDARRELRKERVEEAYVRISEDGTVAYDVHADPRNALAMLTALQVLCMKLTQQIGEAEVA